MRADFDTHHFYRKFEIFTAETRYRALLLFKNNRRSFDRFFDCQVFHSTIRSTISIIMA